MEISFIGPIGFLSLITAHPALFYFTSTPCSICLLLSIFLVVLGFFFSLIEVVNNEERMVIVDEVVFSCV